MKKRMVGTKKTGGTVQALTWGTGLALGLSLMLSALAAAAISRQWIPEGGMVYCAVVILIGSSCGGAWVGGALRPDRRLPVCLGVAGCYFAVLLLLGALFFGGRFRGIPVTAALILGSSAAMALMGLRKGKGRKRKYKRYGL